MISSGMILETRMAPADLGTSSLRSGHPDGAGTSLGRSSPCSDVACHDVTAHHPPGGIGSSVTVSGLLACVLQSSADVLIECTTGRMAGWMEPTESEFKPQECNSGIARSAVSWGGEAQGRGTYRGFTIDSNEVSVNIAEHRICLAHVVSWKSRVIRMVEDAGHRYPSYARLFMSR